MNTTEILNMIDTGKLDQVLSRLYGNEGSVLSKQRIRCRNAVETYASFFPTNKDEVFLFSAPGRTEVGGNHTDHQHGRVLAAAVDMDILAVVGKRNDMMVNLQSDGYPMISVDISDLEIKEKEKAKTSALIRGVAARFLQLGEKISGLDIYSVSSVPRGSGLSSSAAFEVLMGTIFDQLFCGGRTGPEEIARIGQYAENVYFDKACGLMDQMVSSVGGFVKIDFLDPQNPSISRYDVNLEDGGLCLIVTDTKGGHAKLSDEYTRIPLEMHCVAEALGHTVLRDVGEEVFYKALPKLREDPSVSDRAILRSAHFFADDKRAEEEAEALSKKDFSRFLELVNESGDSSAVFLQNLFCCDIPEEQGIPLGLLLSRKVLSGKGACRVHGGGFAGTIQAFVPKEKVDEYIGTLEGVFGKGACHLLRIRPEGGIRLL